MASSLAVEGVQRPAPTRAWGRLAGTLLAMAVPLAAVPVLGGEFLAYQIALFLIYGIATQGVVLCWGRLGFLPLGQSVFFGLAAYLSGAFLKHAQNGPAWYALLPLAIVIPVLLAYLVARLVFARTQRSGPYFSLITLATAMLGFLVAQQWSTVTGGFNGMTDIPDLPGTERYSTLYWLVAGAVLVSTMLLQAVLRRPVGVLWTAIAQDEDRLQLFGYATDRMKAAAFALAAGLAALAGVLFASHQGIVTPQTMSFVLATEFVIWAAVGGKMNPLGAIVGALLVGYASSELRDRFAYWEVIIGIVFILVVRYLPQGLSGLMVSRWSRLGTGRPEVPSSRAPELTGTTGRDTSLELQEVEVTQGGVQILNGLSLQIAGAGIRAVIGPNGAGKTSTFNALTGRLPVRSGRILLDGHDATGESAWRVARRGVGRKMQVPSVFRGLTVRENLLVATWAGRLDLASSLRMAPLGWTTELRAHLLSQFPFLADGLETPAGALSQGHRQALEFSMTVLPEPGLVLLDEPCAGLSTAETLHMAGAIKSTVTRIGAAALLIEHDIDAVAALADEVFVLHQGRLLARGSLAAIQADPAVRAVYAGGHK